MLLVFPVAESKRIKATEKQLFGIDKLNQTRSLIPAVTHVDYSARIQTVNKEQNQRFYNLISHFYQKTKIPIVVNTSFNVRGEPIVRTPSEAYRCFMRTDMDYLVLGNFLLSKNEQRPLRDRSFEEEYDPD